MKTSARWLLAAGLCLLSLPGSDGRELSAAPLVTSDLKAEKAASWGVQVVRAVAASEPKITARHGAHMSTRSGKISGGGMVTWASCRQKFTVAGVLAGSGRMGQRDISYSFVERAQGFPLPRPRLWSMATPMSALFHTVVSRSSRKKAPLSTSRLTRGFSSVTISSYRRARRTVRTRSSSSSLPRRRSSSRRESDVSMAAPLTRAFPARA